MRKSSVTVAAMAVALALCGVEAAADQLGGLGRAIKREAERAVEGRARTAVRCMLGDVACVEKAERDGNPVEITDRDGNVVTDAQGGPVRNQEDAAARSERPGEGVWRNYDFIPGRTVWRATDFANEPVGRFPASQLEFVRGSMQIVELDGQPVLEAIDDSVFRLLLPEPLPEGFSVELMARTATSNSGIGIFFGPLEGPISRHESDYVQIYNRPGIYRQGNGISSANMSLARQSVPVKLQVDDRYAILYVGSERVAQVPNANVARASLIEFRMDANARYPGYISDIVVAVGLDSLYDALMDTGEFTTRGILFETGSASLRPESTAALTDILTTLQQHAELSVVIEGHTDSQGEEADNQDLSERRAHAVVEYLTANGVETARLSAVGRGESEPVADNDTPAGRQENRRVVIRRRE